MTRTEPKRTVFWRASAWGFKSGNARASAWGFKLTFIAIEWYAHPECNTPLHIRTGKGLDGDRFLTVMFVFPFGKGRGKGGRRKKNCSETKQKQQKCGSFCVWHLAPFSFFSVFVVWHLVPFGFLSVLVGSERVRGVVRWVWGVVWCAARGEID